MDKVKSSKTKNYDILEIILKPFLTAGFVIMLFFGLIYYILYILAIQFSKKENYYGDINGFISSVKSIVFSDSIKKSREQHRNKIQVRKARKQSAEYLERPQTRVYAGNRANTRADKAPDENVQPQKNFFFKRLFAYSGVFFLKEEIRIEKQKEIDQKYPIIKKKENYSYIAKEQAPKTQSTVKQDYRKTDANYEEIKPLIKPVWQKRIMIGSVSVIAVCAIVFVGALAYAQELPAGLNFISPKPTANLFQTTVPVESPQVCEVLPDSQGSLYLDYSDDIDASFSSSEQTGESTGANVEVTLNEEQTEIISGNITTEAKIYKQGDEDPEVSKIIEFMCPMGRAGQSGELDTTVIYLASDASTYTTGQIITVDGGWTAL